jgi:hypothetical protein
MAAKAAPLQQRRVAFQSPAGHEAAAATPEPARNGPGADGDNASDGGGTPYDSVLAMLRQGPLAGQSPRSFPRPRSSSLLTAGAGRTPGPGLAYGGGASVSPSPLPPSAGSGRPSTQRGGYAYVGSRLGPNVGGGGGSGTPSTGMRTTYTARSQSHFSRTPVHMQPLAAGGLGGSGGGGSGGAGGTSRFGLAAAAAGAASGEGGSGANGAGAGTSLLSPAPLAWTPMRGNLATGPRGGAVSGGKRKAGSASPDGGCCLGAGEPSMSDTSTCDVFCHWGARQAVP